MSELHPLTIVGLFNVVAALVNVAIGLIVHEPASLWIAAVSTVSAVIAFSLLMRERWADR